MVHYAWSMFVVVVRIVVRMRVTIDRSIVAAGRTILAQQAPTIQALAVEYPSSADRFNFCGPDLLRRYDCCFKTVETFRTVNDDGRYPA